ncbi:hypothetical protein AVEN_74819-1 [Araneus ventricosus]|uniref:Uncharacterized protein n=1 Tax=Araneus ventricosus TaxID=182803 RepID=A0A4Y2HPR2_ARAVE|nr:hypothetical protein AVEN_74819-1 [Araneus ventricosus]
MTSSEAIHPCIFKTGIGFLKRKKTLRSEFNMNFPLRPEPTPECIGKKNIYIHKEEIKNSLLNKGHAPGKLAARMGVSVGIGISSSDHRRVYPLTCILSVQSILMNQHREALSRLSGSSPLVLHGVYRIFGLGMILRLGASSTNGPSS